MNQALGATLLVAGLFSLAIGVAGLVGDPWAGFAVVGIGGTLCGTVALIAGSIPKR